MIHQAHKRGFTAVELIIVISIIALIAGIVIPAVAMAFATRGKTTTQAVIEALVTAMSSKDQSYNFLVVEGVADGETASLSKYRIRWDLNEDGILDGNPGMDPLLSSFQADAETKDINGAFRELVPSLEKPTVDPNTEVIRDAWNQPLRVTDASNDYGVMGFGIFSVGKDGQPYTDDDITSWSGDEE